MGAHGERVDERISAGAATPRNARGFDRLAPVYDVLADFLLSGRIHASQVAFLPRLPSVGRALVVGGGSGRFLCELLSGGHARHAVSIDASAAMTHRTGARLEERGLTERAVLRQGGLDQLREDEGFDLVVTHCFLDLFEDAELHAVMAQLDEALAQGGWWLFSDFATPGTGLPRLARRIVVGGLYRFFRTACGIRARRLPDFTRAFQGVRLHQIAEARFAGGLLTAALFQKAIQAPD